MVDKITYENKEVLRNDETIPSKNKVTANDLNQIKEVVNSHAEILDTKQEKEKGKGLSSNDFTKEHKEKLEGLENYDDTEIINQLDAKVNKIDGKNLSQNDFTDDYREKLDNLSNYDDTNLKTQIDTNQNTIKEIQENKVDKVEGKNLSTNDFTNEWKQKLEVLENYDDTNVGARISSLEIDNTVNKQKNIEQDIQIETNTEEITNIKEKNVQQESKIQANIESIETIREENIELKAECERLKEDIKDLPTIEGNGENITLKDTVEARFKSFVVEGNTIQKGEGSIEKASEIKNVKGNIDVRICKTKEEEEEQSFIFPLAEGQVLHKTDYLAEDGIHRKRKTIVVDGVNYKASYIFNNGRFALFNKDNQEVRNALPMSNTFKNGEILCDKLKTISRNDIEQNSKSGVAISSIKQIWIKLDDATEETNTWTRDQINNYFKENKLTIEYALDNEEIEGYTEEQKNAYHKIQNTAKSYKETTYIYSTNEISPIYKVEARKDIQAENDKLQIQIDEIKELLSTTKTSAMLLDNMQTDLEEEVM